MMINKSEINQNSEELFVVSGLVLTKSDEPDQQQQKTKDKLPDADGQEGSGNNKIQSNMLQNTNVQTSIYTDYEYSNQTKCCDLCGKIFVTLEASENHMNSAHQKDSNNKNNTENQIQKMNETMDDLEKANENNLLWVTTVDNKNELHVCDICNQSFDKKHVLDIHISINHLNFHIFKEVYEGKTTKYSPNKDLVSTDEKNADYIDHLNVSQVEDVNNVHENELEKCSICNKIFKSVFFKQHLC